MEIIITRFEILAEKNIQIEFKNTLTLITGFSGVGKTLMFKLIKYALGDKKAVDIETAKKEYKGLHAVQISFSNGDVFYREISDNFNARVKHKNKEFSDVDEKEYKKNIGALFNHADIKVLKNDKKAEASTFTISEYLNTMLFDESRLTDTKAFIDSEGYTNETKLKNYFKYFLTGKIIDLNVINKARDEKRNNDEAKKALALLKTKINMPSNAVKNKREKLMNKLQSLEKKENSYLDDLKALKEEIAVQRISKSKLISLYDLYTNQLQEVTNADLLDQFMRPAEIKCSHCGNSIRWEPIIDVDSEILRLRKIISDLKNTIKLIDEQVNKENIKIENVNKKILEVNDFKKKIVGEIDKISNEIENYLMYDKIKNILSLDTKNQQYATDVLKNEKNDIDLQFKQQVKLMCIAISNRLKTWKLQTKTEVTFDENRFEFTFNGTPRCLLPKGYRGFCTVAVIIELILHMKSINVPCFNFILIDTVWKVASFGKEDLNDVVKNFIQDICKLGIQIIIFENENIYSSNNDLYKRVELSLTN